MADENMEVSAEELAEAKSLGWAEKENWKGDPERWADAKTFLERGRHILPIVQENNKRLSGQLGTAQGQINSLQSALQAANASIRALEEAHETDVKEQVEAAKAELKIEIERASRDGDHTALADATVKLTELNTAAAVADTDGEKGDKGGKGGKGDEITPIRPDVLQWYKDNPEYMTDQRKRALAIVVSTEFRQAGDTSVGKEFLDKVAAEVENTMSGKGRGPGKVEAGNGGGGRQDRGGSGSGKTYADLPADAKAACDKMAGRLVGPNRAHKDTASWRASYTKQYFGE